VGVNTSCSYHNINTMDTLNLIKLVSLETSTNNPQERREQVFEQLSKDVIKEQEPMQDDEVPACAPPSDEAIEEPFSPAQQKDDEVSFFPFQDFDDTLSHDSENEGEMESLKEVDLPCCTIEDEGVVPEDETMMHEVLEAPA
jgi:hypothetical protein